MTSFDYVIVGSGYGGSLLAKRLTEDAGITVCVLEAGGRDRHPYIHIPVGYAKTLYGTAFTWPYKTEPSEATNHRAIAIPQGRVVGGSSSINGLVYSRGQRQDFDAWDAMGNSGWGYDEVLPYFRRSERRIGDADPGFRGLDGELPITNPDWHNPLCEAFIEGAIGSGIPRNPDYNGEVQDGVGYFQRSIERGLRVSAAKAFLYPALTSKRVDLRCKAEVTDILLEGRRAVGVRYRRGDGPLQTVTARREVLICAGTINSPKLLQLSGIGPGALLQSFGVPVVCDLPGVGENLRDHYTVRIAARAKNVRTINECARGWRLALEAMRWAVGRPSILALSPSLVHVFWKSRPGLAHGDIQVLFTPATYKQGKVYLLDDHPGMTCGARQQRPQSRGYVRLSSADPRQAPIVQPNYLAESQDQDVLLAGFKLARRLMRSASLAPYFDQEKVPGPDVMSDDEILAFARQTGNTGYHLVGTCRMAPVGDPSAVVDSELRVYGVERLRVIDASIMPMIPSANTMAATMMIAEKAADMIRGRASAHLTEAGVA